jgi:4-amino-4-deoxy-L-arabinose transferase-like glycosyltransferase
MSPRDRGLELAILLLAAAVRLPALDAGLPYTVYVDEGHVLHRSLHLLAAGTWEPDTYAYPTLPFYLVAGTALAYSPVYRSIHGRTLREDLSPDPPAYYDILEPPELVVIGRVLTLAFSLGVVLLAGRLARRVGGRHAGFVAAGLAALVPALVARSAIANVNPQAAFFVLLALLFAERARRSPASLPLAALAGAASGLAGVSKYPSALVAAPVALALLVAAGGWRQRLLRLLVAGGAAVGAAVVAMPALVLRPGDVAGGIRSMDAIYTTQAIGSYWQQAVERSEWDLPLEHPEVGIALVLLAAAGTLLGLVDRRQRPTVAAWLLFALLTGAIVAPYQFRAFRNLLALVPLGCAAAGLLYARLRRLTPPRGRWAADAVAIVVPIVLFAPALRDHVRHHRSVIDSRERALAYLATHARDKRVLVLEELAFLPSRLAAVDAEVRVQPWVRARERIEARRFHVVVLGDLRRTDGRPRIRPAARERILFDYEPRAHFGAAPTPAHPGAFRYNQPFVEILVRRPRGAVRAAMAAADGEASAAPAPPTPSSPSPLPSPSPSPSTPAKAGTGAME